ncbi:class I SAM-dependent methyltransferase [Geminicoccaceae bacterium 1502E]|nr:class I SAM-dependent methyltransferase [Geminicoccaceae bacterium 1502E]
MSRLDSFIRRLEAQRACLGHVAGLVRGLDGPVAELGLGNGRTYDHLRELLPERRILVFERHPAAHPDSMPPADLLVVGPLEDTLPGALRQLGEPAALVHSDIGTGDEAANARMAAWLSRHLPPLVRPGGVVLSDQPLVAVELLALPLPQGVPAGRYFLYRRAA